MLQINPPLVNQLTASHFTISERYVLVNCLKEKLKTLGHMIVFLKHDQLIQTEGLIETLARSEFCKLPRWITSVPNFIRHLHISHNAPYSPPHPPQICVTFVFHFSWVLQPFQEKLKTILMKKFWGQIRCIMGGGQVANSCAGTVRP